MKPSLVIAALSVVALVVGGALAEEPPPVVAPTPTPPTPPTDAPPATGEAATAKPEGTPGEAAAPGESPPASNAPAPAEGADPNAPDASGVTPALADCQAAMPQVLAELDYWRERAAQLATAAPLRAGVPPVVAPTPTPAPGPTTPTAAPTNAPAGLALGPGAAVPNALDRPRIDQVAAAVKEMKPKDAAAVFSSWDDALAIAVFEQLSGRAVSAIATALPPDHAARLLAKLSLAPRNDP